MGFSLKQRIRENNKLWAIAFSPETFVDEQKPTTKAAQTEQNASGKQENLIRYHSFATCGGRRATIYEYQSGKGGDNRKADSSVHPLQSYISSHSDEDFFAVTFAQRRSRGHGNNKDGEQRLPRQILCVGGACAKILILDVETGSLQATLKGSISYISDLKSISCGSGPQKYNLLCSATRDQIRIWNLDTLANVCIFAGYPNGHVGDVLSVAWHPTGSRIVSGGGEAPDENDKKSTGGNANKFQICIWNVLDSGRLEEAIEASSYLPDFANDRSQFNPHTERCAVSVHNDVHSNKVDCVAWLGDLVLSKSIFDEIILWKPLIHDDSSKIASSCATKSSILPIKIFHYGRNDSFYFVRFALSLDYSSCLLAIGNNCGQVYLWDVSDSDNHGPSQILKTALATGKKKTKLRKKNAIIRGLAFSPDGQILVGCGANGDVYRWDKNLICQD
jgi:polycomb protein EED